MVGPVGHGRRWALACAAAAVAFVLLSACLTVFVTPSLVALIEQVRPLGEHALVRAYLVLPVALACFMAAVGVAGTPRERLRPKVVCGALVLAFGAALVVLVGDPQGFTSDASKITWFTSVTLMLAGVLGVLNFLSHHYVLHSPLLLRLFWLVMGLVFAFAALDEEMELHEKVQVFVKKVSGSSASAQASVDTVTLLYGLAALTTIGLVYRFLAPLLIAPHQWFHRVFLAAACIYAASTLLDSFDFLLIPLSSHVDLVYMANAVEEIFELTAASLFAGAFLIALLECNGGWLLNHAREALTSRQARLGLFRHGVYAAAAAFAVGAIALPLLIQPDGRVILDEAERYDLQPFAGRAQGLRRPDGMFLHDGRLYVADDTAGAVRVFDQAQNGTDILYGAAGPVTPESVAVNARGTVFVTDDTTNAVFAIDGAGVQRRLGPEDGLRAPKGLTIGPDGALFVSDNQSAVVYRYADGRLSTYATALQLLSEPEELAFDQAGNLYVTEEETNRVVKIAPDGAAEVFVDERAGLRSPEAIAIKDGYVYITDGRRGAIFRFDLDGRGGELIRFTSRYRNLEGIALGEDGAIYVGSRRGDPVPSLVFKITPHQADGTTENLSSEP
jgi:sugar lactone lactonase YvrE